MRRLRASLLDVARGGVQIPSRVGENLFWLGRYSERCEAIARLLRAALVRLTDLAPATRAPLRSIAEVCVALGVVSPRSPLSARVANSTYPSGVPDDEMTLDFMSAVADPQSAGGLAANLARLGASAGHVRERMSMDNWHVLWRLAQKLPSQKLTVGAALEALDEVMVSCVSLAGFAMDDMTRDESWRFLLLGRRLERLLHLSGVAGTVLGLSPDSRQDSLEWLLEAANSIVTFRARYRAAPELLPVLHLVVLDPSNPHAVIFQLTDLLKNLDASAEELGATMPDGDLRRISAELSEVDLSVFERSPEPPSAPPRPPTAAAGSSPPGGGDLDAACAALADHLSSVRAAGFALSDALHRQFFSHAGTPAPTRV